MLMPVGISAPRAWCQAIVARLMPVSSMAWGCSWDLQEEAQPCFALLPSQQLLGCTHALKCALPRSGG